MASTISAGTTSGTAIAIAGDTSGALALQTNNGTTAVTIDTAQKATFVNDASISGLTVGKGGGSQTNNTAVGANSTLVANTTGTHNTAIGSGALPANTTGGSNTSVGSRTLENNNANNNTAIGYQSMLSNTSGTNNAALGWVSLNANTTGSSNTGLGVQALASNTTASNNTAVGYQAGYAATGTGNTFIGHGVGSAVTTGTYNTFIGRGTGDGITTGSKNSIIGGYNGNQGGLDIRTASNNIVLSDGDGNPRGYFSNAVGGWLFNNNVANNTMQIYNTFTTPYGPYIEFTNASPNNTSQYFFQCADSTNAKLFIYSNGTVSNRTGTYNTISDQKIKQDIVDAGSQWDDIKAVRFRKYRLIDDVKANADAPYLLGVVAQELEQTSPALIDNCEDKDTKEITKGVKTSVLLMKAAKALQEAMTRIEILEAKVTALEAK